jgi:hypothetical protein
MRKSLALALGIAVPVAALAANPPSALTGVAAGLWEISGAPGTQAPVRQCVADILALSEYEHRGHACSRKVLSDAGRSTLINYTCGSAGFGQTQIDVITPRSLRISTQGISDQLPFNYVLQARRVGDCTKTASVTHH